MDSDEEEEEEEEEENEDENLQETLARVKIEEQILRVEEIVSLYKVSLISRDHKDIEFLRMVFILWI